MTLEELLKKYRSSAPSMDDMEKAKLEKEIWDAYLATPGRPSVTKDRKAQAALGGAARREDYLKETLNASRPDTANRQLLLNSMPETQPLWDRVRERKMLLETAGNVLRVARKFTVTDAVSLDEGIRMALEEYDSRPYLLFVGGIPVRRGQPKRQASKAEKKEQARKVRISTKSAEGVLLARLRNEITNFLEERAAGVEPILKEKLISEFEVAVKVVVEELRHKMARLVESAEELHRANEAVSLRDVSLACETLHMDPPMRGRPVDLSKAKKQKKTLAREYHPDLHSAEMKDRMEKKFHDVLAAFNIIEKYNEQVSPTGKGDGSGRDRAEGGGSRG